MARKTIQKSVTNEQIYHWVLIAPEALSEYVWNPPQNCPVGWQRS